MSKQSNPLWLVMISLMVCLTSGSHFPLMTPVQGETNDLVVESQAFHQFIFEPNRTFAQAMPLGSPRESSSALTTLLSSEETIWLQSSFPAPIKSKYP